MGWEVLNRGMEHIHGWRIQALAGGGAVTAR